MQSGRATEDLVRQKLVLVFKLHTQRSLPIVGIPTSRSSLEQHTHFRFLRDPEYSSFLCMLSSLAEKARVKRQTLEALFLWTTLLSVGKSLKLNHILKATLPQVKFLITKLQFVNL